jgi:hypothetical protein
VVLLAAGYAATDWIREEYLIWRLDHGDASAAGSLGQVGSLRAVPALFRHGEVDAIQRIYYRVLGHTPDREREL